MYNPWSIEVWRISGLFLAALIVGMLSGHLVVILLITSLGYLAWHLVHIYRLEHWLRQGGISHPPQGKGIWSEIYHQNYLIRQRNRKQKRKLADVINRYRESTTAMPDAAVILRANGEIDWINEAAGPLLGLQSPQDTGNKLINLVRHPDFIEYVQQGDYKKSIEIPSPIHEKFMLEVSIVPYGKDQRLLIARDITRIKRLEQMRRDFVANVSHELRTPLTVLNGLLETMSDANDHEQLKEWKRSIQLMYQQTSRMQHIVNDLLLLSRLETDGPHHPGQPVAIPAMLAAMREEAITLSGSMQHEIHLDADPHLWLIGNEQELHSVFYNLINNAIRYTPERGKIYLRWYADQSGAHFEVKDTGIGIAPQHISRLTERFYRVDVGRSRETGGTGLGLAIVKHALERHDAVLRIESKLDIGSTFICDFPANLIHYRDQIYAINPDEHNPQINAK